MSEIDLLNDLLNSNPNAPAAKGEILLLRLEMKSEFKSLRSELDQRFGWIDQKFVEVDRRFGRVEQRLDKVEQRLDRIDQRLEETNRLISGMAQQIAILVEHTVQIGK